jgi:hypothetical protein
MRLIRTESEMARDVSGNYTLPSGVNPVVEDTLITPEWANDTLDDLALEVTASLERSGKGGMIGQLKIIDGSLSTPGIGFGNDLNTGLARLTPGAISAVVDGAEVMALAQAGITFPAATPPIWATAPSSDTHLTNKLYVDTIAFSEQLPLQTGNAGKVVRTNGTTASWTDAWGTAVAVSSGTTLSKRTAYNADSTSAAFTLTMPASPTTDDWVIIRDVGRNTGTNNITLNRNGSNFYGAAEDYLMDVSGETVMFVYDATKGWVRA